MPGSARCVPTNKNTPVRTGVFITRTLHFAFNESAAAPRFRRSGIADRYFRLASACHVSMIVSGFSEIDTMPSSVSHCAKSG